ncbi:toprim domain-containing protein [Mesorhizobium sp. AR02]|uniref:DUF7146 domain-containing protein n=1 Tax=Mesorhizobium sp. AR02 TaxID=2865837 RepID=UPI00215FFFB6|nr:toprim domain-containing protein [Mesorhizobium sp. AR02]UVK55103.1 toprim domain-containing protein [Mesorhizobium sp. AR02]
MSLRERAQRRWHGILGALGVPSSHLTGKHGPCPMCGGKDRFRFDNKDGKGTFYCSQCGAGDGVQFAMKFLGLEFKEAAVEIENVIGAASVEATKKKELTGDAKQAALDRLWRGSVEISKDDPVARFLAMRGLGDRYPDALRYSARTKFSDDGSFRPAMLAALVDIDGKPINIHRTFLTLDGRKAEVGEPRRMMPGAFPDGAAIHLASHRHILGIAEGIETSLAATILFGVPCWSAVNSTGLEKWVSPAGVSEVVIFGDNDPKFGGQAAAFALAHRLAVKGLVVRVEIPPMIGDDWNDVLLKHGRVA